MSESYEVVVVGLGAMGSATLFHLARRGVRVLGLDRFPVGHTQGSSHGDSRIIRELYYEHPLYVPLLRRAYELWGELEAESGSRLLHVTGGLMLGPPDARVVTGSRAAAIEHGLPYEDLGEEEIHARFPALRPPADYIGVWDMRAGYLEPEVAIRAHLALAERYGAVVRRGEAVTGWESAGAGFAVATPTRRYHADRVVLTVGAWMTRLTRDVILPLQVERQVLVWFDPVGASAPEDAFAPARFPIYLCEDPTHRAVYGFPRLASGVKAAIYHEGETVADPDRVRRSIEPGEIDQLRRALARFVPALASAPLRTCTTCLFTNTPDTRFVIDRHPAHPGVVLASPCSGHGFKFASAVGEVTADLVLTGRSAFDLAPFALARFTAAA
jgi:sarcosine oxidase